MRKSLRSRQGSASLDKPNKGKLHSVRPGTSKVAKASVPSTPKGRPNIPPKSSGKGSPEVEENVDETTEIGRELFENKSRPDALFADPSNDDNKKSSPKNESNVTMEYHTENSDDDADMDTNENNLEDETDRPKTLHNRTETSENEDNEDSDEGCVETVLKEFNKDIAALYSKTNKIESDIKEIKKLLLARPSQSCIRSISSRLSQKSAFSLLPKFPLLKKSAIRKMNASADAEEEEEDNEYKDQLIKKLASFGGETVNELVINIFKKAVFVKIENQILLERIFERQRCVQDSVGYTRRNMERYYTRQKSFEWVGSSWMQKANCCGICHGIIFA